MAGIVVAAAVIASETVKDFEGAATVEIVAEVAKVVEPVPFFVVEGDP